MVQAWKQAAEQLSPNGIPATLLVQALYPINMALGASSDITEWGRVEIHPDMAITYGQASGCGHVISFAQLISAAMADLAHIDMEQL